MGIFSSESNIEELTQEGVKEEDFLWWRKLRNEEKVLIKETDADFRLAFLKTSMKEGTPQVEAIIKLMKSYAFYEEYPPRQEILNLVLNLGLSQNDNPLPYELHGRVDKYLTKLFTNKVMMTNFQEQLKTSSSFNACIRNNIKDGLI